VTREPLPRFDLYGELEVSPLASVGAIEAAYRSLVKRHHPDVAGSADDERIKRLNLAREWLTDRDRRSRYDASRARATVSAMMRPRDGTATTGSGSDSEAPAPSFGVNAAQVRQFLAELRGLDEYRARQVWDGRAVAHARGYTGARRAAMAVGRAKRHDEWLFAREAASVIARGELGDSILTERVLDVVADIAGAIAVRDLLPGIEFDVLLLPWTWRGEPVAERTPIHPTTATPPVRVSAVRPAGVDTPAAPYAPASANPAPASAKPIAAAQRLEPEAHVATPVGASADRAPVAPAVQASTPSRAAAPAAPSMPIRLRGAVPTIDTDRLRSGAQALAAASARTTRSAGAATADLVHTNVHHVLARRRRVRASNLLPVVGAMVALVAVGGVLVALIRPPSDQSIAALTDAPGDSTPAQTFIAPQSTPSLVDPSQPFATSTATSIAGGSAGPTIAPGPGRTPGPGPTPKPTPTSGPTPTPTAPTPGPICTVPNFIGQNTRDARRLWHAASFTGTVTFSPAAPPHYVIQWQRLTAGTSRPCTSGITVSDAEP
jgi:hypothetical protein